MMNLYERDDWAIKHKEVHIPRVEGSVTNT